MPGTIQISVVEIVNPPSPSSPASSMSFKVTMGKREYQIGENGSFAIPLTTLQENLVVKLLDSNGNEVSRTGVETKLVVEKGLWDDFFPFEGGGKLHLKMQFSLSEEEQSRIRMMRLSALRKKHGELLSGSPKASQIASAVQRNITTLGTVETSGSSGHQGGLVKIEADTLQKQIIPRHTNRSEETSLVTPSQKIEAGPREANPRNLFEKMENWPPHDTALAEAFKGEKDSSFPHSVATHQTETQDLVERTPSNVRKMISVFESSLAQDMQLRPSMKPPPAQTKLSIIGPDYLNHQFKGTQIETTGEAISRKVSIPFLREGLQRAPSHGNKVETAAVSGRGSPNYLSTKQSDPSRDRSGEVIHLGDSKKIKFQRASDDRMKSASCYSYEDCSHERSSAWIFPDEPRDLCITAGGKRVMCLMEHCSFKTSTSTGKIKISTLKTVEEHDKIRRNGHEWKQQSSYGQIRPRIDGSTDAEPSGGPAGQVMKIAIMVGFGALVFFTRQRKDR